MPSPAPRGVLPSHAGRPPAACPDGDGVRASITAEAAWRFDRLQLGRVDRVAPALSASRMIRQRGGMYDWHPPRGRPGNVLVLRRGHGLFARRRAGHGSTLDRYVKKPVHAATATGQTGTWRRSSSWPGPVRAILLASVTEAGLRFSRARSQPAAISLPVRLSPPMRCLPPRLRARQIPRG